MLVFRYPFLATPPSVAADCLIFALRCSLITYHRYLLAAHAFSLMLIVPLKRSAVFHSHITFQCSVPVSRCSLLATQFFCLLACSRRFFLSYYSLFATLYSILAAAWVRVVFALCLADNSCCSLFAASCLVQAGCNWFFAKIWS